MSRSWVGLWLCAFLGACSAESDDKPAPAEEATASTSDELRIATSAGNNTDTCPGGGSPTCVTCKDNSCQWSCAGAYTCNSFAGVCYVLSSTCKTVSFAPSGGFATFIP
jgi:hypothetical protein